jgi:membrane fusion protein (multidrug efflux system)
MDKRKKILGVIAGIAAVVICYVLYEHFMYVETDNAQVEAHSVMLAPKVSGFVVKVNVVEGQKVKAGDILVEIDERDYQNTLRQAKAELASLSAKKGDSEKNLRRITALYSKDAVSAQQHDSASTTFGEVNAKYESLSAQVAQAELNLENTKIKAPSDGFIAKKSANIGQLFT